MTRSRFSFSSFQTPDEPTVNLTPLIDVVFVILIMFIVIAPLLELDQVELADAPHMPLQTSQSVQESSPITIHVHPDNTIWFNNQLVSLAQLREQLKLAKQQFPKINPQVFHDRRAQFGTYQSVKNAAEEAGFAQLEIILKPA
ncbi:ExbD/TolR family protein [Candidatus Protochlamydia phocaeensis]|uniref:ExbD/TolR family protein n=1 Tax=Candidatus Protochlamydia phocaeensis TaxID=1414722 RepID=UPI000838A335|nr:biopolymer transporter ExbD [Candidatus Protochlamydia phocaeensis]